MPCSFAAPRALSSHESRCSAGVAVMQHPLRTGGRRSGKFSVRVWRRSNQVLNSSGYCSAALCGFPSGIDIVAPPKAGSFFKVLQPCSGGRRSLGPGARRPFNPPMARQSAGLPRCGVREPAIRVVRALIRGLDCAPGLDIAISDYDSEYRILWANRPLKRLAPFATWCGSVANPSDFLASFS
jgi:hypothetical protein